MFFQIANVSNYILKVSCSWQPLPLSLREMRSLKMSRKEECELFYKNGGFIKKDKRLISSLSLAQTDIAVI